MQNTFKTLRCGHSIQTKELYELLTDRKIFCPECKEAMFFSKEKGFYPCFLINGEIFFSDFQGMDMEFREPVKLVGLDDGREMGWSSDRNNYGKEIFILYPGQGEFSKYCYYP